ncbi:MAG: phosphate signaling complex protein PhoU [Clostridia bacterium]|nr:phosphate signaling complex protein PhoU [Clostridia bacterium]MBQ8382883.1 phosphate signaling complex protein PhoU [Clostridia bacterium]
MRDRYNEQLKELSDSLIHMGSLCEVAISAAMKLLLDEDEAMAEKVAVADGEIDQMEREIEQNCMKLLLLQHPMAHDLRSISAAMKMISDMERIGDQAFDIAELAPHVSHSEVKNKILLKEMAVAAIRMVTDSIDSFVRRDLELAHHVMESDDVVDDYFNQIKAKLISLLSSGTEDGEACIDLLMVAKYLERIGDHAENIAEWVEFSITGIHKSGELKDRERTRS